MMQRSPKLFVLTASAFIIAVLSGCNASQVAPLTPTQTILIKSSNTPSATGELVLTFVPTETETLIAYETATLTQPAPTNTPNPFPTNNPDLCSETYCILEHNFLLQRPISGDDNDWIDPFYPYGSTASGIYEPHHGVEFNNAYGTSVLAASDGVVVVAGEDLKIKYADYNNFYGNLIVIEHGLSGYTEPVFTLYGHLSEIEVTEGQWVKAGEPIGAVGVAGAAIGSHLHFEVRLGVNSYDQTYNPALWLPPKQSTNAEVLGMLAGLIVNQEGEAQLNRQLTLEALEKNDEGRKLRYYFETYASADLNSNEQIHENFVLADLPAGDYRLTTVAGKVFEFYLSIHPGKISFISIQIP
ncbi:MAG: M23 family metallopeptidase [Chloroflexota bacterium]